MLLAAYSRVFRRLVRRPASAAGIVLMLALGIGISVTGFSLLHAVLLRTLPYPDAERIVVVHTENLAQGVPRGLFTTTEAEEGLRDAPGFEHIAYYATPPYVVTGEGGPRQLQMANVSQEYFDVFGVSARLGRTLSEAEITENRPVATLSHRAWLELTGGDADVIGQTLTYRSVQGRQEGTLEIVGVLPESFAHPDAGPLLYVPWGTTDIPRQLRAVYAVGRLAGPSAEPASQGLQARLGAFQGDGVSESDWRIRLVPLIDDLVGDVRVLLIVLFAVSALVLLVACSTTASLISIRLRQRDVEYSIRRTLGAGDARVASDIALELVLLAALGAVGGTLLAAAAVEAVPRLAAGMLPRASGIALDPAAIGFAAAVGLASLLLSGIGPLLRSLHVNPADSLRGGTRSDVTGGRHITLLPPVGVGTATVALVVAMALSWSLIRLGNVELGFRTENISALQLVHAQPRQQAIRFLERTIEELRALPGVGDVAAVGAFPPTMRSSGATPLDVSVPGSDGPRLVRANVRAVSAAYHRLLEIPLLGGRDIDERDTVRAPRVAVINETLARQLFGTTDAAEQSMRVSFGGPQPATVEVVGVVADTRNAGLHIPTRPEVTFPIRQYGGQFVTLLVDSPARTSDWTRTLEQTVRRIDPDQAINRIYPLADDLDAQSRSMRFMAIATGWFALLALLLGSAGVYAVVATMQQRREREVGLRLALGATPQRAAALVLLSAARLVAVGLAAGALLSVPALGWIQDQLLGVQEGEPWNLLGLTASVLAVAGLAAGALPAWRASRIEPMDVLRNE